MCGPRWIVNPVLKRGTHDPRRADGDLFSLPQIAGRSVKSYGVYANASGARNNLND